MTSIASNMEVRIISAAEHRARRERLRMNGSLDHEGVEAKPSLPPGIPVARWPTLKRKRSGIPSIEDVQEAVAHCANIPVDELLLGRKGSRVQARLVAVHLSATVGRINNSSKIGRHFKRDHSTICSARKRIETLLAHGEQATQVLADATCEYLRSLGFSVECAQTESARVETANGGFG